MKDWDRFVRKRLSLPGMKGSRERDIVAEIASQLEDVYSEALSRGYSEEEAHRVATFHISDWDEFAVDLMKAERSRRRARGDAWAEASTAAMRARGGKWTAVADLIQDLRYSLRSLRATPGFTVMSLLTLALGIGGVATILTLYDQVLLRPLPYEDSDELVTLWEELASFGGAMVAYPNFLDWRERNRTFEDMAAWNDGSVNVTGSGDPMEIDVIRTSASAFPILGTRPLLGRPFLPEEDKLGAPGVVVLSHSFWRDHFGENPAVVGRTLTFDEEPFTVVGVMPPGWAFPSRDPEVEAYVPMEQFAESWIENRGTHPGILVLGRLREGVTLQMAREDLERIALELEAEYPDTNQGSRVGSAPLQEFITGRAVEPLRILMATVALLLLIACINVANLVLARATSRHQEMAVRVSLGAGGRQLLRLLLTESLFLWSLGGTLGVALAVFGVRGVVRLLAEQIPPIFQVGLDLRIVGAVLALSLFTGLVFGLPPALRLIRRDLREYLKEGVRTTGGMGRSRFRNGLVVAEVGFAVALLVGAGLTLKSFSRISGTSPGLDPNRVLVVEVNLPEARYAEGSDRMGFFTQLLDRVRALNGVESAATAYTVPLGPGGWQGSFHVEGEPPEEGGQYSFAEGNAVSTDYFRTMGIPLLQGRDFNRQDDAEAPLVAIVGESFVQRYWADEDPLGKRFKWGDFDSENPWVQVVGVAGDVKVNGVTDETLPQIYLPHWQDDDNAYYLVLKTRGDPLMFAEGVRREVLALDPAQPLASVGTMEGYARETTRSAELLALLMGVFAVAAILLAGVGIYGVMAQMTAERRHEIGIRVALGARRDQVLGLVFRQGLVTTAVGVAMGLGLAVVVGRLVSTQLFQVSALDPLTFVATPLLVVGIAMVANLLPARRATKLDPVRALQAE